MFTADVGEPLLPAPRPFAAGSVRRGRVIGPRHANACKTHGVDRNAPVARPVGIGVALGADEMDALRVEGHRCPQTALTGTTGHHWRRKLRHGMRLSP